MTQSKHGPLRVAVLGANGQVGTELCLYLKAMDFCEPIAVTRSPNSTALLSRANIRCRSGDLTNRRLAATLLADCDLIVDLALPVAGNLRATKRLLKDRAVSIFSVAHPAKGFVLASTTSVYRFSPHLPFFRAYRSMKLFAERVSRSLGTDHGVPVFVFRLGQVHGELQSCSQSLRRALSATSRSIHVPAQRSNAVFVYSIADAIRVLLFEPPAPGTYDLVLDPAWTFEDLVRHHAATQGFTPTIVAEPVTHHSSFTAGYIALRQWITEGLASLVGHYRELLSATASYCSEDLEQRLRFSRIRRTASSTISAYLASLPYRPFEPLREPPGARFPFSSHSQSAMAEAAQRVMQLIHTLK